MNNLNIRTKFLILGIIAFLSLLSLALLSMNINQRGFANLNHVFTDFKKVQNLQSNYIEPLFILRETMLTMVMSPNDDYKKRADEKLMPILDKLEGMIEQVPQPIIEQWKHYKELLLATRSYALQSFDEGSFMNAVSEEREAFYTLIDSLKTLQKQRLEDSQSTFTNAEKHVIQSHYYLIVGFFFITVISFLFDSVIVKQIVESIEKVQYGLQQFFTYLKNPAKTDEHVFIKLDHNDELGKMAKTINQHVAGVQEALNQDRLLIQEATQTVNHLKEGKFGQRLSLSSNYHELNALKDVMNEMMDSLEQKIQAEIKQRSDQEKLLVQQSKLAAMGNMLGNIAHQWRQPISEINAILMEVEAIARYDTLSQEKLLTYIHTCCDVTEHMSNTIYDFQNFFQPSKNKESFSVMEACNNAISIINASLKYHNITLSYDYAAKDSLIIGYPNEFAHAVLNILSNAKDVLIERRVVEPSIRINIKTGKHFTIIRIEDNGGGIAPENIDRIFEPYFTTKHAKQGTGIGLYMTKAIIENNMQGYVNVENTDKGALFSIKLHLPL